MDKKLCEILACPHCKGELLYDTARARLICKFDRLVFPVIDGIPMMLEEKASRFKEGEY